MADEAMRTLVLGSEPGIVLTLLDFGATVARLDVTGGDGRRRNVVLGHGRTENYLGTGLYLGATIGRYANRIADGRFPLVNSVVNVGTHDRGNSLHGGPDGFDQRTWDVVTQSADRALLRLVSPDGDQGFPGTLEVEAEFRVSFSEVSVRFRARTDQTTVVNLTQHAYFNLSGEASGPIVDHLLSVEADEFTPVDRTGIPLSGHEPVEGTPFDLRTPTRIGTALHSQHCQLLHNNGIDHNFVVRGSGWRRCATLTSERTKTRMTVFSDQPGVQIYTGNYLDGTAIGPSGTHYWPGDGIAIEPQAFPDSPNRDDFPSTVLERGALYEAALAWSFSSTEVGGSPYA